MDNWVENEWKWQFYWRRTWLQRDQIQWSTFQHLLSQVNLVKQDQDKWVWLANSTGDFSVHSAYTAFHNLQHISQTNSVCGGLWQLGIPPTAAVLMWRLVQNALPTVENLQSRGVILSDSQGRCAFCNEVQETSSHLFFCCRITNKVWHHCWSWISISTVLHQSTLENVCQYPYLCLTQHERSKWDIIRSVVIWCIWRCRNNKIFRGENVDVERLKNNIDHMVWSWLKINNELFCYSFDQWMASPAACLKA
uniref:Reverse transcriptase zinc-binding domain-containing protein n=1 Tax=Cajanus cajan TaxID=3821 RepID=A0A151TUL6_CAJCA|nr:hypothetical protein KK1_009912 [Cajanus cajan]